jgi:hypothetical protein
MSDNKYERGYASVANEEYRKGYRDGWRDAMNDERLDKSEPNYPPIKPTPYTPGVPWTKPDMFNTCSKCGAICGPYQICKTPGCPTSPQHYTGSWHIRTTDNTSGK